MQCRRPFGAAVPPCGGRPGIRRPCGRRERCRPIGRHLPPPERCSVVMAPLLRHGSTGHGIWCRLRPARYLGPGKQSLKAWCSAKAGPAYGAAYWRHAILGQARNPSGPPSAGRAILAGRAIPPGCARPLKVRNPSRHAIRPGTQSVSPHPGGGDRRPDRAGGNGAGQLPGTEYGAAQRGGTAWCRPTGRRKTAWQRPGSKPAAALLPARPIGRAEWCRPNGRHGVWCRPIGRHGEWCRAIAGTWGNGVPPDMVPPIGGTVMVPWFHRHGISAARFLAGGAGPGTEYGAALLGGTVQAAASRAAGRSAGGKKPGGGCSEVPRGTSQGRLGASSGVGALGRSGVGALGRSGVGALGRSGVWGR